MPEKTNEKNTLIIGAGNVGTSLFRALNEKLPGQIHLFGNEKYSHQNSEFLKTENYSDYLNQKILDSIQSIIICVQDDLIKEATQSIFPFRLTDKNIFHTSGAKDSSELDQLKERGAFVASIHPLQSFSNKYSETSKWHNIILAFQGDNACYTSAEKIAKILKSKIVTLNPKQKVGLHVAGVFAANYLVALLGVAEDIIDEAGIDAVNKNDILIPLIQGVIDNYKQSSADKILSGPLKRGDVNVLQGHIEYLTKHQSENTNLYLTLAKVLLNNPKFQISERLNTKKILDKYS